MVATAIGMGLTQEGARWWMAPPALLIALLLASNLRVVVDARDIRLTYFPLWRRTIPLSTVETSDIVPYRWVRYGGWGIRFGFDGSISYSVQPDQLLDAIRAGTRGR